jgi:4-amino-4-deoxy-L-arabinose transferase-like glycosyltransferase
MGDEIAETSARPKNDTRRFWAVLGLIIVVALGVRVVFVVTVAQNDKGFYDAAYYELQADANADGKWFTNPFPFIAHPGPAADHPPLTAVVLTPIAMIWRHDNLMQMRYFMAALGAGVVLVIGLLGRRVGGNRVGWLAAGIAAVYPYLWVNDGLIMSETLAAGLTAGAVLLTYRLRSRPGLATAAALGVVCGLATLTRAELALLAPLLVIPTAFALRSQATKMRVMLAVVVLAVTAVVVAPWMIWNADRFDKPVLISTNEGIALLGSSCQNVFYGPATGLTDLRCLPNPFPKGDQSDVSAIFRKQAFTYIGDHAGRFPVVLLARVGRTWSLFRPGDMLSVNAGEGRPRWITGLGLGFYYPLLALAIGGVVVLIRRRASVWPLVVPAVVVTAGTLLAYGQTRFRVPAEPSIVVLAAIALVAAFDWLRSRRAASGPGADPEAAAPPTTGSDLAEATSP